MRENRETPLLQAAIANSLAVIFATVYLRHSLPVSGISFFNTLRQSKPVQPLNDLKPRTSGRAPLLRGLDSPSLRNCRILRLG
jgi:hypothetical protein